MQIDEYQQWTEVYWNKTHDWEDQTTHAILGLCTEAAEVADIFVKARYSPRIDVSKIVDRDALKKELGDALFFVATLGRLYNIPLSEILIGNVHKLEKRYG